MNELTIINHKGINVTDSKEVAEMISKKHDNLLRDIRGYIEVLEESSKLRSQDFFIESSYKNCQNKTQPCYLLTKQGCEMVANKMTGKKGVLFTAEYVQAFNKMEQVINNNFSISEFKGQVVTLINTMFEEKLSDVEKYYKIKSASKHEISQYIKTRLGIIRANEEYDQVKARVFILLGISKWEDLDIKAVKDTMKVIDESIRVIKMDRPQQLSLFDNY